MHFGNGAEEYDEYSVDNVDGIVFPPQRLRRKMRRHGWATKARSERKREIVDGGLIGWSYVVVRQNMEAESEVLWADQVHLTMIGSTRSNIHRATTSM